MLPVLTSLAALALSALLVPVVRRYAVARLLDLPNARSSHQVPTPRGGGLAIAAVWLASLAGLALAGLLPAQLAAGIAGGALLMAAVGWRDDHGGLSARARFVVHLAAGACAVGAVGGVPEFSLGVARVPLGIAGSVLAVLGMVWLTNLYNFMDGIDGLAGSQAVAAGAVQGAILWDAGATGLACAAWALAAAAAGFLVWNWPPARIFMGDVGSGMLGFAFGALALAGERTAGVPLVAMLIPLGVFIVDATITFVRRLARGERVYQAHRSHAYQRLVQLGRTHGQVTLGAVALYAALAALAWIAWRNPPLLPWAVVGAVALTSAAGWIALTLSAPSRAADTPPAR